VPIAPDRASSSSWCNAGFRGSATRRLGAAMRKPVEWRNVGASSCYDIVTESYYKGCTKFPCGDARRMRAPPETDHRHRLGQPSRQPGLQMYEGSPHRHAISRRLAFSAVARNGCPGGTMATERLSRRGFAVLLALALARIGFGFQLQTVGSLGPQLRSLFGLDYAALGVLIGIYMLPGAFVALPLGLLGRRFGDHLLVSLGLALMAFGGAIAALSCDVRGIALGRMVSGIGAVAMIVMQGKIIADWFSGRFFLVAISISVGAFPVGLGLGQMIQPPLANAFGWHAPFWGGAAILAVATLLFVVSFRTAPGIAIVPRRFSFPSQREVLLVLVAGAIWAAYTTGYSSYVYYLPSMMAARGSGLAATGLAMATCPVLLSAAPWSTVSAACVYSWLARWR
jgi:MFS family permease